jgi:hypothetical protein
MIQQKADFFLFIFGSILLFSTKISSRRLFSFNLLVQELNHNREGCIGSWMGTNGAVEGMLCSNSNRQVELKGSQKTHVFLTPSTKMRTLLFCRLPHPSLSESKVASTQSKGLVKDGWKAHRGQERVEWSDFKEKTWDSQIESKQSQKTNMIQKCLFGHCLPHLCHK